MSQRAMAPKKRSESTREMEAAAAVGSTPSETEEDQLQREYDKLTDTLHGVKRRVEQLRRDNQFLQNEANQTRMESQDYMSRRTQRRQSAIISLSEQNQQELEGQRRQREETLEAFRQQASELKGEILEREHELALLQLEIADLGECKSLQQQQLGRIAELEREVAAARCRHSEGLQVLKARLLVERRRYEGQAKRKVQALALAAKWEASRCLHSHTREVSQVNQQLHEELQRLIQRAQALRHHQGELLSQRQQLLLERQNIQELHCRRASSPTQPHPPGGATTETLHHGAAVTTTTAKQEET